MECASKCRLLGAVAPGCTYSKAALNGVDRANSCSSLLQENISCLYGFSLVGNRSRLSLSFETSRVIPARGSGSLEMFLRGVSPILSLSHFEVFRL